MLYVICFTDKNFTFYTYLLSYNTELKLYKFTFLRTCDNILFDLKRTCLVQLFIHRCPYYLRKTSTQLLIVKVLSTFLKVHVFAFCPKTEVCVKH